MAARLRNLVIDRVDLVDKGANQKAHVVLVKRDVGKNDPIEALRQIDEIADQFGDEYEDGPRGEALKGTLSSGQRNALPDSAFAAVWTDKDGKKRRKFPYKRADGSVDLPHLRNALARLEQN